MKKFLSGLIILCCALFLGAGAQAAYASLTFGMDSLTLSVGRYKTVTATVSPAGAVREGALYSVSDEHIASVDANGKVRALKAGECTLTAVSKYDQTVSISIPVTVIQPAKAVKITAMESGVVIGGTLQLSAVLSPEDTTVQTVTFTSSDESILTVDADGLVTGIRRGTATVTAKSGDGKASGKLRIAVKQPPSFVTVSPETLTLAEGKTGQLKADVSPRDTDDKTVLWTSMDESIATVSDRGEVTGVRFGETVVVAACKDNENATFAVLISVHALADSIAFEQDSYDVEAGESLPLYYAISPFEASSQPVSFQSSNPRIASVDEYGVVTPHRTGTATITVSTSDGSRKSAAASVHVTVPVTGVSYARSDVRVAVLHYANITVDLEPSDATNTGMVWFSADPDIATVTGDTNAVKITGGESWGRTSVTGVTDDGGYEITLAVNVGSLNRAVTIRSLDIRDGDPYFTLRNESDLRITQVYFYCNGLDSEKKPIKLSTSGDPYSLTGTYGHSLPPGAQTQANRFTFDSPSDYRDLSYVRLVITGFSTDTGYYDANGTLQYDYTIGAGQRPQSVYPSGTDSSLFQ